MAVVAPLEATRLQNAIKNFHVAAARGNIINHAFEKFIKAHTQGLLMGCTGF